MIAAIILALSFYGQPVPKLSDLLRQMANDLESGGGIAARIEKAKACSKAGDILGWGAAIMPEKYHLPFCKPLHGHFVDIRHAELTDTEAPRDHAKTAIKCNLIPLYQALEESKAFDHYLNVQATDKKALAVNVAIRHELEYNEVIRAIYGDQVSREKWTDQQFVLKNGVVFTAASAGQSIRGINYLNRRPDYIVVDDLYDDDDINNPDSTLKKNDWFWSSLYPARAETRRCSIHVQGTAINKEDLLEQLKTKPNVVARSFRAVTDWDKGEVLWPELMTFEKRKEQRVLMPSVIFAREYQNERRDDASSIVKRAWLDGWEFDPADLRFGKEAALLAVIIGNDPSIGEKVENDYTGTALVLKTRKSGERIPRFWITGLWNEHLSLDGRIAQLQRIGAAQPPAMRVTKARIEAVAGFKDYAAQARKKSGLPVEDVNQVKDKISVLESKSWYFEQGLVKISRNITQSLRDELVHQLTTNHPKNDDLRDALLLCLDEQAGWAAWA